MDSLITSLSDPHLNMKTQKRNVSFSLSVAAAMLFSVHFHSTLQLSPFSLQSLPGLHIPDISLPAGKLFSKQCMVLTLRWKRHAEIILAGWYHTASPNGTQKSDLFMIPALSEDDLCAQHHLVSVYESLDRAQAVPFKNHLSRATLWAK